MKYSKLAHIMDDVDFPDYEFFITEVEGELAIYGEYLEECVDTGDMVIQQTREWKIAPGATKSDVVRTCFALVMASAEHKTREHFHYRGKAVFGPHITVGTLLRAIP
jgi:hypothetical protein